MKHDDLGAPPSVCLTELRTCFEGVVPAVIATAAADGTPNVTYLSRVHVVDDERIALSNQFFSKTSRNLAENPRASLLLIDPRTYDEYRLAVVYERTERHGALFEKLRHDVEVVAALSGMQDVFRLRAADIYRVLHVQRRCRATPVAGADELEAMYARPGGPAAVQRLAELTTRLSRCSDLDMLVDATIDGLHTLLGYEHAMMLLLDETGQRLYTIASHGYPAEGVGSEVAVGEGIIGMAAERATPIHVGSVHQMRKYGRTVRAAYETGSDVGPGREIELPGLPHPESQAAVPMIALGQLVGVLMVESSTPADLAEADVSMLSALASLVASAIEIDRREPAASSANADPTKTESAATSGDVTNVRFFAVDGSTFLDGDYLIKGVAGRILWSLLVQHQREHRYEFTNREVRLDPTLELPEFRDNLESRLILLKRRLDERAAPIRIEKTGRGRFRLIIDRPLRLDEVAGS